MHNLTARWGDYSDNMDEWGSDDWERRISEADSLGRFDGSGSPDSDFGDDGFEGDSYEEGWNILAED